MKEHIQKQRTSQQNRALWLFFTQLAEELNNAGLDMRLVLKPTYSIPWTSKNIHDHLWIPFQKAMYEKKSTTELEKLGEIEKIHEVLMRELGLAFHVEFIPFPSTCEHKHRLEECILCERKI